MTGCTVPDDLSNLLGDSNEGRLSAALTYIETGACPADANSALTSYDKDAGAGKLHPLSAVSGKLIQPELGKVVR